jgi:hypothetical protein
LLGSGSKPLQLFGLRKTPELSLALLQAHRPLGATGSVPATGGSDPTARSHILTDLRDTRAQGMPGASWHPWSRVQQKSTRQNHRFSRKRPAFPAQWCYGLYVLSPVTSCSIHTFWSFRVVPYLMRRKASRPKRMIFGPGFP